MTIDSRKLFQLPISGRYLKLLYFLIACIPALLLLNFILIYGVDVPFWDQWTVVPDLLHKRHVSDIFLKDLLSQHNEHRILSLRLIVLAVTHLISDWNIKLELLISYGIFTIASFFLGILAKNIFKKPLRNSAKDIHILGISILISNLLIFSTSQYENWLWGFQIAWFLIVFLLCVSVQSLFYFNLTGHPIYFILASLSCLTASFSSAHGLFCWIGSLPMFLTGRLPRRKKYIVLSLWISSFLASTFIYLWGYDKPPEHPELGYLSRHPLVAISYYLNLIGGSFGRTTGSYALILGVIFTALLAFFIGTLLCQTDEDIKEGYLPWLSISFYAVIFAALTTVGRSGFGGGQALASRYSTISLLVPVGLINLWRISLHSKSYLSTKKSYLIASIFVIGFLSSNYISGYVDGLAQAEGHRNKLIRGKACLEVVASMEENAAKKCLESTIFPDFGFLMEKVGKLQEIGFLNIRRKFNVDDSASNADSNYGELVQPKKLTIVVEESGSSDVVEFNGWADRIFATAVKRTRAVIFLRSSVSNRFFAVGDIQQQSLSSADPVESQNYSKKGSWYIRVPIEDLPAENSVLKAYLYDLDNQEFYPLNGAVELHALNK